MKNIGVFFGSRSPEHDISIITAQLIIAGLKSLGHQVIPVYITKKGEWLIDEKFGEMKTFTDPSSSFSPTHSTVSADAQGGEQSRTTGSGQAGEGKWRLDMQESNGRMVFKKKGLFGKPVIIDIAFPALHGSFGEDGTIQGLFEMLNIPYVGCGVAASAIAMDKALTKQMYQVHNIPTTKFVYFYKRDWVSDKSKILNQINQQLSWPVFVKPVHLGSSIGIAKLKDKDAKDLEFRIEVALHYDEKVLVEESVENLMDVTCCVIGNENLRASLLQETVFQAELLDFEEKYITKGGAQTGKAQGNIVIPARLDELTAKQIQEMAKQTYGILGCSGIARIDFLYNKQTKKFYANEVNPLPGTLYHHLWKASGLELNKLLQELIRLAEERHEKNRQVTHTFESSVLRNLKGSKFQSLKSL